MQLTEHYTSEELSFSQLATRRGISNEPTDLIIESLKLVAENLLEPLYSVYGDKLILLSGYRVRMVNVAAGGSRHSDHEFGQAVDINVKGMSPTELWKEIALSDLKFDQLIYEHKQWVHISYKPITIMSRLLLSVNREPTYDGRFVYAKFLLEQVATMKEIM